MLTFKVEVILEIEATSALHAEGKVNDLIPESMNYDITSIEEAEPEDEPEDEDEEKED